MLYSELLDSFYCGKSTMDRMDAEVGFGCWLAKNFSPKLDPANFFAYEEAAQHVRKLPGYMPPAVGEGDNDLYAAPIRTEDGVTHVMVYAFQNVLTTQDLSRDWRYILLAYASLLKAGLVGADGGLVDKEATIILQLFHPAGVTYADIKSSTWNFFSKSLEWANNPQRAETPTAECRRCQKRSDCKTYTNLVNKPGTEFADIQDKGVLAQRLLNEYMDTRSKEKYLSERRKEISKRLRALSVGNRVNVNDLFLLEVSGATVDKYNFEQTCGFLQSKGLWKNSFAKIDNQELKKALPSFPEAVQKALEKIRYTETREPEVRGMVEAATHSVQAPYMRGIVLRH